MPVEKGEVKIYRDRNILYVGVFPISYNKEEGIVRAAEHIAYRIEYSANMRKLAVNHSPANRHEINYNYMESVFTNIIPPETENNDVTELMSTTSSRIVWHDGGEYLILSREKYSAAVTKLANWKKIMGYNVKIIYSEDWTPTKIKSTVQNNYSKSLQYLLLFGDEIDLPGELHQSDFYYYTDYFYACLDGEDDSLPDVAYGRISVTSSSEATTVVDKIIDYENLYHTSGKAVHCAEFTSDYLGKETRAYTYTSECIANGITSEGKQVVRIYNSTNPSVSPILWSNGDSIPKFLRTSEFNWSGNNQDILAAINLGPLYAFHRDHGDIQKWHNPEFTNYDVAKLSNGNSTPVVFSINCLTGMYQYYAMTSRYNAPDDLSSGRSTCLAEAFLRKENGGAVAVIAASQLSPTYCNDAFAMEMFQLMWPKSRFCYPASGYTPDSYSSSTPIRKLGDLLNAAKLRIASTFIGYGLTRETQIYHCFGDPSMEIKDVIPVSPNVVVSRYPESSLSIQTAYSVSVPVQYKLVRVPIKETGNVVWGQQANYLIPLTDMRNYNYYVIGDNIAPHSIAEFMRNTLDDNVYGFDRAEPNGDVLNVKYALPKDVTNAKLSLRGVTTTSSTSLKCEPSSNESNINIKNCSPGVYLLDLEIDGGVIIDTMKIMIK